MKPYRSKKTDNIDVIIRNAYGSMITHVEAIKENDEDGLKWHTDAIQEYAAIIKAAAELYDL